MRDLTMALLPGLDGSGRLFDRFIAAAPRGVAITPISLPTGLSTYDELVESVDRLLPTGGPLALVAESFSGPLAVRLSLRRRVAALVFCNSFVSSPSPRALRWLVTPLAFRWMPAVMIRRYLVGPSASESLVEEVVAAVRSVPPRVLASRLRSVLTVDDAAGFAKCDVPVLYIRSTEDRLVTDAGWRRMAALRPIIVADVAGSHLLLQANPSGAWEAILPFLTELPKV